MEPGTELYSAACIYGETFYVLNGHLQPAGGNPKDTFQVVSGGSSSVLFDGNQYGGLTLDDIVQSAFQGFRANNNHNGFDIPSIPDLVNSLGSQGDQIFQTGNLPSGFVQLPVCTNIMATAWNIGVTDPSYSQFWPCLDMIRKGPWI
jgi:hypothetical protein